MDDPKPRHEAYSYASASDIEPAEEFPILYRLLTAEGKGTKRSSSSSSFLSSNHLYFPINHHRRNRKSAAGDSMGKEGKASSTVEADSTSDISLTHILARSKFISNHDLGRHSRGAASVGGAASNKTSKRKGKKSEKIRDNADDDEMLPSSTTNDDDGDYFYNNSNSSSSPPRKRPKFQETLKRALQKRSDSELELDDDNKVEDSNGSEESQEPLLVSSLSVNERLAVLLGQQQVNNSSNNNNSNDETEPPNLVPYNNNNLIVNTQSVGNSRMNHEGGALRTLLSRPPRSTSTASHRKLIFPNATIATSLSCPSFPASMQASRKTSSASPPPPPKDEVDDETQKKILIKGVVEQLRAAASQRLNSFFSQRRSSATTAAAPNANGTVPSSPPPSRSHSQASQAIQLQIQVDDVRLYQCSHCDLTFSRLHHLSQHESAAHRPKSEKFFCSLCSQEFQLTREGFQSHVEECFDRKYPPQSYTKKSDTRPLAKDSAAVSAPPPPLPQASGPLNLKLRTSTKQYVGLSELLEAKVEDSSPFHSFVLPSN